MIEAGSALDARVVAALGPRGAIEAIAASRRTALVLLDRGPRVGEIWLDRGRLLCTSELLDAAASLAELLAWPSPHVTVVPGARRPGPCVAIPASVLLQRADEVSEERLASLSLLSDPTELHVAVEGAAEREGDVHERAVLAGIGEGASPFAIVPNGHARIEIAQAIVRLVRRRAIVRATTDREPRRSGDRSTAPGSSPAASGPFARLLGWARSCFGVTAAPSSDVERSPSRRPTHPCATPGWRASEERDLGLAAEPAAHADWAVLPWDRDRAALGSAATTVADRLSAAIAVEMASADPSIEPLLGRLREVILRGLEDVPPISPLAATLRDAIASEATAREVATTIASDRALVSAVLREGSAAAFGRPPGSLEHAVVRIGLSRVHRLAVASLLDLPVFEARTLGARATQIRVACRLAAELAAELAPPWAREELFLAGLAHGLGRLYLASLADRSPHVSLTALDELACDYQSSIGVLLCARWGLGRAVAVAVGAHADASPLAIGRATEPDDPTVGPSTLRVAQIVACGLTESPSVPDWRIAGALGVHTHAPIEAGPLFERARTLLADLV